MHPVAEWATARCIGVFGGLHQVKGDVRDAGVWPHHGTDDTLEDKQQKGPPWEPEGQRHRHDGALEVEDNEEERPEVIKHLSHKVPPEAWRPPRNNIRAGSGKTADGAKEPRPPKGGITRQASMAPLCPLLPSVQFKLTAHPKNMP